jgi:pyridoxine 5-phosphate synthase
MLKLGVNIDHLATLRQARYARGHEGLTPEPDIVRAALAVEAAGAHGITVHLREDRRHIQDRDVRLLRQAIRTRLNLEMADVPAIVAIAEEIQPAEVCLVPEKRQELTTEGGLNVRAAASLQQTIPRLQRAGSIVSLFIDADPEQIRAAAEVGANCIELHTGTYANARGAQAAVEIKKLIAAAELAHQLGLQVNAGHGLNYDNTTGMFVVPHLDTLNTGHAIVSRAVFIGLQAAVTEMLTLLKGYRP